MFSLKHFVNFYKLLNIVLGKKYLMPKAEFIYEYRKTVILYNILQFKITAFCVYIF